MAPASIALVGLLLFYVLVFVAILTIVRKKLGIKYVMILIDLSLLAGIIYSIWIGNWLLVVILVLMGIGIRRSLKRKQQ